MQQCMACCFGIIRNMIADASHIIDISIPVTQSLAVYPGNPPVVLEQRKGYASVHTAISFGSHTGTHIDAPNHVFPEGLGIESFTLGRFIGTCRVLDMTHRKFGDAIRRDDLEGLTPGRGERFLFKTKNSERGFEQFYDDYVYLDGDAAVFLAEYEPILVGIDGLSVKQRGSHDNRPHTELLERGIPILEGLDLSRVFAGVYTLICLPLSLPGLDGAPARAILLPSNVL